MMSLMHLYAICFHGKKWSWWLWSLLFISKVFFNIQTLNSLPEKVWRWEKAHRQHWRIAKTSSKLVEQINKCRYITVGHKAKLVHIESLGIIRSFVCMELYMLWRKSIKLKIKMQKVQMTNWKRLVKSITEKIHPYFEDLQSTHSLKEIWGSKILWSTLINSYELNFNGLLALAFCSTSNCSFITYF